MDNRFMPPPPTGARNNMPPPPPPRREPPKKTQVEENASAVSNIENATTTSTVSSSQSTFMPPPRDFSPKFKNETISEIQDTIQPDFLSEKDFNVSENEVKNSKGKTKVNLKTVLYWGGFAISIALIILFGYLLFI